MPTRPDLRDLVASVREAFGDSDRDTLLDILTFVVKEYVVEGPPPMLMHQAETIAELGGMSFAQLITALQTRLELPELALFAVDGDQVSVRIGGVMHPLQPGRTPPAAELPRPQAGVRVVESNVSPRPPQPTPEQPPARTAPPPSRGVSVRGRGDAGAGLSSSPGGVPPTSDAATPPPAPPTASSKDKSGDEPSGSGDDAAERFSLLELD